MCFQSSTTFLSLGIVKRIPNILSILRILLAPLFVFLYLQDAFFWAGLGLAVFIAAAITDYLDGFYARRYNASSPLGMFLDPLADKILTFAGFFCLPFIDSGQFPWWIIGIIVFRDILITLLRAWSEHRGKSMKTRYLAKVKTFVQMVFLYAVLILGILLKAGGLVGEYAGYLLGTGIAGLAFYGVMIITVYTALEYVYLNRRLFLK